MIEFQTSPINDAALPQIAMLLKITVPFQNANHFLWRGRGKDSTDKQNKMLSIGVFETKTRKRNNEILDFTH